MGSKSMNVERTYILDGLLKDSSRRLLKTLQGIETDARLFVVNDVSNRRATLLMAVSCTRFLAK